MGTANVQGELWGARAKDWAELCEAPSSAAYEAVFGHTGVRTDTKLLDIGCGGGTALAVARSLGANVTGLDASRPLVEIARTRVPGARVDIGEMEDLPFPNAMFDVVTGFNSFQFAENPLHALREARRVCKPRGYVAAQVWGKKDRCESLTSTVGAILALLPPAMTSAPAKAPTFSGPLSDPGVLERTMEDADLTPVASGDFDIPFLFRDVSLAWRAFASAGAVVAAIQRVGEEPVKKAALASFAPFTRKDGSVLQRNRFHWVVATVEIVNR